MDFKNLVSSFDHDVLLEFKSEEGGVRLLGVLCLCFRLVRLQFDQRRCDDQKEVNYCSSMELLRRREERQLILPNVVVRQRGEES